MKFEVHGPDYAQDLLQPWWEWDERCLCVAALVDEKTKRPVSCARVFRRKLEFEGDLVEIPVAGIGGVFTVPEFRKRGFAAQLLRSTVDHVSTELRALAAVLYARERTLYRAIGFHPIKDAGEEKVWVRELVPGLSIAPSNRWSLRPDSHF